MNALKEEVTIVLPCYNDEVMLPRAIRCFKEAGFNNILVINDGSQDDSRKIALRSGVRILENLNVTTFDLAVLKGIYQINTRFAVVAYFYETVPKSTEIQQFIEFGITGNYSFLSDAAYYAATNEDSIDKELRKRYGLVLPNSDFSVVFFNGDTIKLIKERVGGTGAYVYFEILKVLAEEHLKIGVYPFQKLPPKKVLGINEFLRSHFANTHQKASTYFKYSYPDPSREKIVQDILIDGLKYLVTAIISISLYILVSKGFGIDINQIL